MEDKEFNKIMDKYVESTKGSMEKDFSILKKPEFDKCAKRKPNKKIIWMSASALMTIVAILSIVLPVTLVNIGDDTHFPVIYQINKDDVVKETASEITNVPNYNNFMLPQIDGIDQMVFIWRLTSNNLNIGFEMQVNVWNEQIESIGLIVLKREYEYNLLNSYYHLSNEISWNGHKVFYGDEAELNGIYFDSYIYFERDGYRYYIESKNYELVPIRDLLEIIF